MLIPKPWGSEEILERNSHYMVKRLFMKKGHRCSLQFHEMKHETLYVLQGKIRLWQGTKGEKLTMVPLVAGQSATLPPGQVHRMEAEEDSWYLESSTPENEDVVRLADDYFRVSP